jgi:diguanylate cyclase
LSDIRLSNTDYGKIAFSSLALTLLLIMLVVGMDYSNLVQLSGDMYWTSMRNDLVIPSVTGFPAFFFVFRRFRLLARAKRKLETLANCDGLTGALNRRAFQEAVDAALGRPQYTACAMLIVDIDHFKSVNDRFGHDMGDQALIAVTRVIAESTQDEEVFGRLGGEEFVLFLPRTTLALAKLKAEHIRAAIESNPFGLRHLKSPITVSIGVAVATETPTFTSLYKEADSCLYQAKRSGRNCVVASSFDGQNHGTTCETGNWNTA